jgi:SAM-dependent methyltransferase
MDPEQIRAEAAAEGWWSRGRADVVLSLLPSPDGRRRVLDVGSGWGAVTSRLGDWGEVIGVEPSEVARREAEGRGVRVIEGTAEALPVEDGGFDLVISSDVIEHLPDDAAALREIVRVLRPGGLALITVPANPRLMGAHDRALGHHRRYTRGSLRAAMGSAGLEVERVTHFSTVLYPLALPVRLLSRNRPARADSTRAPGLLDELLYRAFRSERRLLARRDLPFGLSLAALGSKSGPGVRDTGE